MTITSRLDFFLLVVLLSAPRMAAQQVDSGVHPGERVYVDAVVTQASGTPVSGLQQEDFRLSDNGVPQTITSFTAVSSRDAQISVIVVLDLRGSSRELATTVEDVKRFLRGGGGELAYPTTLEFVTNKGLELRGGPSRDGNAISASLKKPAVSTLNVEDLLDPRKREERFAVSFPAFASLVATERDKPGRKIIIWISPGWPPVVNSDFDRRATKRQVQQLQLQMFGNVVQLTRQLYQGQTTVYSVSPPSLGDSDLGFTNCSINTNCPMYLGQPGRVTDYPAIQSSSDIRWDELELRPIALRSGGLALYSGHDLASTLRQCIAETAPFYELSFDPMLSDAPNKYHSLNVQVAKPGLAARARRGYYSQPWPVAKFADEASKIGESSDASLRGPASNSREATAIGIQDSVSVAHADIDLPLDQLVKKIPDLAGLHPAEDETQLSLILEKTGQSVDAFVQNIGDLIAREDLTQERLSADGKVRAKDHVEDNYLILRRGYSWGANAEYRMDDKGNRLEQVGLDQGYLVTAGHALSCIQFSTVAQSQSKSRFRYLGTQMLGASETYVLAFAQRPGEDNFATVMAGTGAKDVEMQTQGILWVGQSNFQILRLRSELLESNREIQLDELTTDVTFAEVRLEDFPTSLWLPSEAVVYIEIGGKKYRNMHRFQDYRRYRVAVKIGAAQ
jgi:VWFA-related protein